MEVQKLSKSILFYRIVLPLIQGLSVLFLIIVAIYYKRPFANLFLSVNAVFVITYFIFYTKNKIHKAVEVTLADNYLIISDLFNKEEINLSEIDRIEHKKIAQGNMRFFNPMTIIVIHFSRSTSFGNNVLFIPINGLKKEDFVNILTVNS